jgi:hypothetical protein
MMRQKNLISCVRVPSGAGQRLCIIISCMQRNRGLGEALDWIWDGAGTSLFCTNAHTTYLYLYLVDEGACERCEEACIYFNVTMKEVNLETSSTCYLCVCMCCIVPAERAPCRVFPDTVLSTSSVRVKENETQMSESCRMVHLLDTGDDCLA